MVTHPSYLDDFDEDSYDDYAETFNPLRTDRSERRKRKPRVTPPTYRERDRDIEEVVDPLALEGSFQTTYRPSKHEAEWLLSSLRTFYDQQIITDVLAVVKGGKEASVYRCEADPGTGREFIAAKVYRPRKFRILSNDAMYRQGRQVLTADGHVVHENQDRVMRAIGKKSAFGKQVAHTSWLTYEYQTLESLHAGGGAVPKPIAAAENAILMSYLGDEAAAAPTLIEVRLDRDEAQPLYEEVVRNIRLMLGMGLIHGDLSAYNILYWEGAITLIDFPQVVDAHRNSDARFLLERDVTRISEYFARQGAKVDARRLMRDLWADYEREIQERLTLLSVDEEGNVIE